MMTALQHRMTASIVSVSILLVIGCGSSETDDATVFPTPAGSGSPATTLAPGADSAPGESTELPVSVSTSSCNPALGFEIPAGEYTLVADVFHSGNGTNMTLYSTPLPITITN